MTENITVVGNIVTELRKGTSADGVVYAQFRIASDSRYFDRTAGKWVDGKTNFYGVSAFHSLAEHAYASLQIGDRVLVSGKLSLRQWEHQEKRGISPEIQADAIGPDLRWGTTVFQKSEGSTERAQAAHSAGITDEVPF